MKVDSSTPLNSASAQFQLYNGLDCCITLEVFEVLQKQLREDARVIYNFERTMQAVAMEMMLRGFRVDMGERRLFIERYEKLKSKLEKILNRYAYAVWKQPLNANSHVQLKNFFYSTMGLPEQHNYDGGERKVTTDKDALERLRAYYLANPIINCINSIKGFTKKLGVLNSAVSPLGRMHTFYGVASTETGRWNSSKNAFGEGTNLQNITPELRIIFIADEGKKLLHFDQEQAESRVVGLLVWALFDDRAYLDACESGDLHTSTAKMLWPHIKNKFDAEQIYYRHLSFRDMSKRGGHASNYLVTPPTLADHLQIEIDIAKEFQEVYFGKFKGIRKWQQWTAGELQTERALTNCFGFRRGFYGNPYRDDVIREGIAFNPQSTVGMLTNIILYRARKAAIGLEALTNEHDGGTWQYDERLNCTEIIAKVQELSDIEISFRGKSCKIPLEFSTGWNWASNEKPPYGPKKNPDGTITPASNPDGLMKWRGEDGRRRTKEQSTGELWELLKDRLDQSVS